MPETFIAGKLAWESDFHEGIQVSDFEIEGWIRECLEAFKKGKTHHLIATGNSIVSAHKWEHGSIDIVVVNDGYKNYNISKEDFDKDENGH